MDPPPASARPAIRADLPGLLDLFRHLDPEDPPISEATAEATWAALDASGAVVLVTGPAGAPTATCTLAIVPNLTRGARPWGVIENVVTHPDHRRQGLGHAVLRAALDAAWAAGCYKVALATGSRQEGTLHFYEKAGLAHGGKTYFEARAGRS